jgi:hypothetical protein
MDPIEYAWNQIDEADLPAPVYRTAVRLLRMAAWNPDGYVRLTKPELMSLCGTDADGTMRRHLLELSDAEIIHYSTNKVVYISFHAWRIVEEDEGDRNMRKSRAQNDLPRAPGDLGEGIFDQEPPPTACVDDDADMDMRKVRALGDQSRALDDLPRANYEQNSEIPSHARVGWLVGTDPRSSHREQNPTNQPPNAGACARVREFLTDPDIGLDDDAIDRLPAIEFRLAVQITFAWLDLYRRGKADTGLLIYRLRRKKGAAPLRDCDRQSELCRRHAPEAYRPPKSEKVYVPDEYSDIIIHMPRQGIDAQEL